MSTTPALFDGIKTNTFGRTACTPVVDDAFRGLCIVAPQSVTAGPGARLVVCGISRVTARFLNRFHSMDNEIVLVVADAKTGASWSTNLLREGFEPEPRFVDAPEDQLDEIVITGWFNVDVFDLVEALPRSPASYHVFATVGDLQSNVVTVNVVKP